jgi:cell wall-associated NlpC family hydrolase
MPGAVTAALSAPLQQLLALLGAGHAAQPSAALDGVQRQLGDVAAAVTRTADDLLDAWAGTGAASADDRLERSVANTRVLAGRLAALSETIGAAAAAVTRVRAELERLIADFEARGAALETQLDTPGAAEELVDEARRALSTAEQMVDDLRTELAGGAQRVTTSSPQPAATTPAGFAAALPSPGGGFAPAGSPGSGLPSGATSGLSSGFGSGPTEATLAAHRGDLPEAAQFGAGEAITLPDGSTAMAPNAVAAGAVRHALTQLGVPYQWGGTAAGIGLDCSGLTQWAYREAGLDIPRLAQEQDIGAAVDAGSLRPGDLAVWDGHVAMIVGNGTMIEAGDPVQLSAIRTTNAGQGFQGFWRPTV